MGGPGWLTSRSPNKPDKSRPIRLPAQPRLVLPRQRPPAPGHSWRGGPLAFSGAACARTRRKGATTPLTQGGPPGWTWRRTPEALKWEVVASERPDGQTAYELRVQCGLEVVRLQFFTAEEARQLATLLAEHGP